MVSDLGAQGRAATGEGGLLRGLWGPSSRPSSKKCLQQYYKILDVMGFNTYNTEQKKKAVLMME